MVRPEDVAQTQKLELQISNQDNMHESTAEELSFDWSQGKI